MRKGNLKDMIQDPGGAPILKSDTLKSFEAHVLRHNAIYPVNKCQVVLLRKVIYFLITKLL